MPRKPRKATATPTLRLNRPVDTRVVYCGDNIDVLKGLADACVDLIYIDPPFGSGRDYEVFWGEASERRAFEDRRDSPSAYIDYMRPRCRELSRVLRPTGSFFYHCDWHASHHIRLMLDGIFGAQNFHSEIIWRRALAKGLAATGFPNNHDTILYYGGGGALTFHRPYIKYDPDNLDAKTESKYSRRDADGRRYHLDNLINPNPNRPNLKYEFLGVTRVWRWTKDRMQEAYERGLVVQPAPGKVPRLKRFLDEQEGRPIDTIWVDIPPVNSQARERVGYPTQKPVALLDRIIKATSNPGDVVLDAFCGCGTTLESSELLGRRWIGIDMSPTACTVVSGRLERECKIRRNEALWKADRGFIVKGMPITREQLRAMDPLDFQNWAIIAIDGWPNKSRGRDLGIDGKLYVVDPAAPPLGAAGEQLEFTLVS